MAELNITFGRFTLKSLLGKGSFGEVFKAYDPQLKQDVALKVLHQGLMADLNFVNKARKEAGLVQQIHHPNVVKIFELGDADGRAYIEMEFIDGQPLSEIIRSGRRYNIGQIVSLIEQISSALEATHAKKIIHRDVKPANILIDKSGIAHLVDFGLAHAAKSSIGSSSTSVGLGTAMYMSPEQALGRTGDKTSDVYSLGVVAFELFTGRSPFKADNLPGYIDAHLHQNPPDPRRMNPGITKEVQKVLFKVLSKNSSSRYKSTGEFTRALRRASENPESGVGKLLGCLVGAFVLITAFALVTWAFIAGPFREPTQKLVDLVLSVDMTATGIPDILPSGTPGIISALASESPNQILTPTQLPVQENTPTSLPTLTPTFIPVPIAIPTITPNYSILLKDDFELGISNQWYSEGNWLMTNGRLTPAEIKDSSIYSIDTSWVNYEGDITFDVTENLFIFVMVRFQNTDNFAEFVLQCGWNGDYFSFYTGDYMLWRLRKNGNTTEIQGTRTETSCRNEKATINFSVVDNVYRATYKGNTISFADPDYTFTTGGIGLRFYPFNNATNALVQFDEIIIKTK